MSLESYLRAAPKAELHLHLEGSIWPGTLIQLARHNGVALPAENEEGLREWFRFRDFGHFVEVYSLIIRCLKSYDDYALIVHELGAELARQNVRYAEVTFSAGSHERRGVPFDTYFAALSGARERVRTEFGVQMNWVFDIVRDFKDPVEKRWNADFTTSAAIEAMGEGVVALGLGGMEAGNPPDPYAPYFERAIAAGLHSAPHAGETGGPESVRAAVELLHAERVGHGVRSVEDPSLVRYLAERGVVLEVCPSSNLRLGVFPDAAHHPLRALYDAGVPVTVNSDDPPLFNTTLTDEVLLLPDVFGFNLAQVDEILLNGVRHSFMLPEQKNTMLDVYQAELDALKASHISPFREGT